jgi:hypothetical protein
MQDNDHENERQGTTDDFDELSDVDRPLAEVFDIEICYAPDDLAPPVDRDWIRRFLDHQLPQDEAEVICCLIGSFRPWQEACAGLLRTGI